MLNKRNSGAKWSTLLAIAAGGALFQSSCTTGLQAVAVGLEAVAGTLAANQTEDNDINFGDWLAGELSD